MLVGRVYYLFVMLKRHTVLFRVEGVLRTVQTFAVSQTRPLFLRRGRCLHNSASCMFEASQYSLATILWLTKIHHHYSMHHFHVWPLRLRHTLGMYEYAVYNLVFRDRADFQKAGAPCTVAATT